MAPLLDVRTVGDGDSCLSSLADEFEAVQLKAGAELLGHTSEMLSDHKVSAREPRFLVKCLSEALCDALRVAESRGGRLPRRADSEPLDDPDGGPKLGSESMSPSPHWC
nr:hypothetical protein [Streptomyces sparsogenes]